MGAAPGRFNHYFRRFASWHVGRVALGNLATSVVLLRLPGRRSSVHQTWPSGEMAAQLDADLADSALALSAHAGDSRAGWRAQHLALCGAAGLVLSLLLRRLLLAPKIRARRGSQLLPLDCPVARVAASIRHAGGGVRLRGSVLLAQSHCDVSMDNEFAVRVVRHCRVADRNNALAVNSLRGIGAGGAGLSAYFCRRSLRHPAG